MADCRSVGLHTCCITSRVLGEAQSVRAPGVVGASIESSLTHCITPRRRYAWHTWRIRRLNRGIRRRDGITGLATGSCCVIKSCCNCTGKIQWATRRRSVSLHTCCITSRILGEAQSVRAQGVVGASIESSLTHCITPRRRYAWHTWRIRRLNRGIRRRDGITGLATGSCCVIKGC